MRSDKMEEKIGSGKKAGSYRKGGTSQPYYLAEGAALNLFDEGEKQKAEVCLASLKASHKNRSTRRRKVVWKRHDRSGQQRLSIPEMMKPHPVPFPGSRHPGRPPRRDAVALV